ncbi:MAG: prevent-host-death family protein [Afipia broomeae]|jgi:antitoxin Phd
MAALTGPLAASGGWDYEEPGDGEPAQLQPGRQDGALVLKGPVQYMTTDSHIRDDPMKEIQLKDAKATLSAVVDRAVAGEPTAITRHGRKEAVLVSYQEWERISKVPSFADLLLAFPGEPDDIPERSRKPARVLRGREL